jgi:hypothetical protein
MKTIPILLFFFTVSPCCFAQQLTYKSGGNIVNAQHEKLMPSEIRALWASNAELLSLYNQGRNKKTIGSVLFYGGIGLLAGDIIKGLTADVDYPTALSYVGVGALIVHIPVKIGYPKKIKKAITIHNQIQIDTIESKLEATIITNQNGIRFKITF